MVFRGWGRGSMYCNWTAGRAEGGSCHSKYSNLPGAEILCKGSTEDTIGKLMCIKCRKTLNTKIIIQKHYLEIKKYSVYYFDTERLERCFR